MENKELHHFSHGQTIAEYVILIAIVSAVLMAMQTYTRRGLHAAIKVAADQVGKQEDSWEDVGKGARTDSDGIGISSATIRERTLLGGNYVTDVDEVSESFGVGQSVSQTDKNY